MRKRFLVMFIVFAVFDLGLGVAIGRIEGKAESDHYWHSIIVHMSFYCHEANGDHVLNQMEPQGDGIPKAKAPLDKEIARDKF